MMGKLGNQGEIKAIKVLTNIPLTGERTAGVTVHGQSGKGVLRFV